MLNVVQIAEACSEPSQTSNMNLFAKIINGCKGKFKTLSNIWDRAFPQIAADYKSEFTIFPSIYDGAFVFL